MTRLRAKLGDKGLSDPEAKVWADAVLISMSRSTYFLHPPITMEDLTADILRYDETITASLD